MDLSLHAKVIDLHDIGMAQAGDGRRFTLETGTELFVGGKMRGQHLDGHIAVEHRLVALVDLGHPPLPQGRQHTIVAQSLARQIGGGAGIDEGGVGGRRLGFMALALQKHGESIAKGHIAPPVLADQGLGQQALAQALAGRIGREKGLPLLIVQLRPEITIVVFGLCA